MKYIITSGPMQIAIDNVRKIENSSTGSLGVQFVETLTKRQINDIVYIHTPTALVPSVDVKKIQVDSHQEIIAALKAEITDDSIIIHAMAISDFEYAGNIGLNELAKQIYGQLARITSRSDVLKLIEQNLQVNDKLESKQDQILALRRAPKIIDEIKKINRNCKLVGFKLLSNVEQNELLQVARTIQKRTNADYIVANLKEQVGKTNHQATIINNEQEYVVNTKEEIAEQIVALMEGKNENIIRS